MVEEQGVTARPDGPGYSGFAPSPDGSRPSGEYPSRGYAVRPVTVKAACSWIARTHRHLPRIQGALFAAGVSYGDQLVGVATAGNPPRVWQGTGRIVISRVAVLSPLTGVGGHAAPVCTMLYGAICKAAKALGYTEAWTYTLPGEPGTSLRAAGFSPMGQTSGGEWDRPSRRRSAAICPQMKQRWMRRLASGMQLREDGLPAEAEGLQPGPQGDATTNPRDL